MPERHAWRVWHAVRGQIVNHEPSGKKDKPGLIVIDGQLAATIMREWEPIVPPAWRHRAWNGVQLLDDVKRGTMKHYRTQPCIHDADPLALAWNGAERGGQWCDECSRRWQCKCGPEPVPFLWCSACQG